MLKNILSFLFLGSLGFTIFSGYSLAGKEMGDWKTSEAEILNTGAVSRLTSTGKGNAITYKSYISYQFSAENETFEGKEIGIFFQSFGSKEAAEAQIKKFVKEKDGKFDVRYIASNPNDSYLAIESKLNGTRYLFSMSLITLIITSFVAVKYLKNKKREPVE
jgi:hypothetical protein